MGATEAFEAVDAHHHLWDRSRLSYKWLERPDPLLRDVLGDYGPLSRSFLAGDLLSMYTKHGIEKSVHVEAWCADSRGETVWLMETADQSGIPNAIVAHCDLTRSDAPAELEWHADHRRVRGVRMRDHPEDWDDREFADAFRTLADLGLSYEFNASPPRLNEAAELGSAFPDARIVLGHMGAPLRRDPDYFSLWREDLRRAARSENVWVKLCGLGMADHSWSMESMRPWVFEALDAFGPGRCMFGTNWPVDSLYSDLEKVVSSYRELLADLGSEEQRAIFKLNAETFYRI